VKADGQSLESMQFQQERLLERILVLEEGGG